MKNNKASVLQEFEIWKDSLGKDQQKEATSFFTVIKRHSEFFLDSHMSNNNVGSHDLYIVPYSQEYESLLAKAADLLHKAGDVTNSPRYIVLHHCSHYYAAIVQLHARLLIMLVNPFFSCAV